jgi:hypothetical protein
MGVSAAIEKAKATLGCEPVEEGRDPRWQAIIDLSEYLRSDPEPIWTFIQDLHDTRDEDLQAALATCLLEHLFEEHPQYRERAEVLAAKSPEFRNIVEMCW